ncbi:MAG: hypothetical protein SFX74_04600 [Fimbriimonadaceae bacterium]|nr:hypothetical protein [Fimbriimonadaceae bacterium]
MIPILRSPFSFDFAPDRGALAEITVGERRIATEIYPAVRDAHWGTLPLARQTWRMETSRDDRFHLEWMACAIAGEREVVDFRLTITQAGDELTYSLMFRADVDFETCRTGFCVHHCPGELAGMPVTVTHPDGSRTAGAFPSLISPHQPFFDIAALTHPLGTHELTFTFDGEVFEMEDQRNWSDFSYKTYPRPLSRPFPYVLVKGEEHVQTVTIRAKSLPNRRDRGDSRETVRSEHARRSVHPDISGYTLWSEADDTPKSVARAAEALTAADPALIVWLIGDPADRLSALAPYRDRIQAVAITEYRRYDDRLDPLRALIPDVKLLAASASNFTELNRNRPSPAWDGVAFAVSPVVHQVHVDAVTATQFSWQAQVDTARSWGFADVHLGPIFVPPGYPDFEMAAESAADRCTATTASVWRVSE